MAVFQWIAMPRVIANGLAYSTPQATSAQRTDSSLMAMLQQTVIPRVVSKSKAVTSPIAKSAHPYRQNTPKLGEAQTIKLKKERSG